MSSFPPVRITGFDSVDVRFRTSRHLDGSDAMNPDPDHSAAYVVIGTSADEVAYAIAYLAAPTSGSTTGTALEIDGGMAGLRLRPRSGQS
jgi:hypothetical protein